MSDLASSVLEWNKLPERFVATIFEFASRLVHDNGMLLLFHLDDLQMKADIRGCLKAYHFSFFKEFMGVNPLQLTSAKNASKTMSESCILKLFLSLALPSLTSLLLISYVVSLFVDLEVLHSSFCEELSRGSSLHLLYFACARARFYWYQCRC